MAEHIDPPHSDTGPDPDPRAVEVAPLESEGNLAGFLLLRNWPRDTVDWAKLLVMAVRLAAVPGFLPRSTVFSVNDEHPHTVHPRAVGIIIAAGPVIGAGALAPGDLAPAPQPPGLLVLHPPKCTVSQIPGHDTASGCFFFPGLPHLGLDHRAAWAQADMGGNVTHLVSKGDVDPFEDADTAALASLLVA
ncbi:peptidase [Granulicoccus sp. GXG6511]|uniref:peptidase n=1 Tax=Granulicoccus sp. GXG6511 TaxID=3381351 RepID=UPI003D7D6C7E